MGKVTEFEVDLPHPALSGADWADAYAVETTGHLCASARDAARRCFGYLPRSIGLLMTVRNALVKPFGVNTGEDFDTNLDRVGFFPVLSETGEQIVMGLDDRHLDFRLLVQVENDALRQRVCAITLIKRHNWFGRIYLFIVTPFHRIIMRRALGNLLR